MQSVSVEHVLHDREKSLTPEPVPNALTLETHRKAKQGVDVVIAKDAADLLNQLEA